MKTILYIILLSVVASCATNKPTMQRVYKENYGHCPTYTKPGVKHRRFVDKYHNPDFCNFTKYN